MAGQVKSELNVVDLFVKQKLLGSPGLFGNRLSVLQYLFFTGGNGYFWNDNGTLGSRNKDDEVTEMSFADLDRAPGPIEEATSLLRVNLKEEAAVRKKRLRAIRVLIAEDIDVYACRNVMLDTIDVDSILGWNTESSLIGKAPFDVLDHAWAKAMMEVLSEASRVLREALRIEEQDFSRETADPMLLSCHDKIKILIGKVANVPGLYNKSALESVRDLLQRARDQNSRS